MLPLDLIVPIPQVHTLFRPWPALVQLRSSLHHLIKSSTTFPPTCHRRSSPNRASTAQRLLLHRTEHSVRPGPPLDTSAAAAPSARLPGVAPTERIRFESALSLRSANERHLVAMVRDTDPAERNDSDRFHRKTGRCCHRGGSPSELPAASRVRAPRQRFF